MIFGVWALLVILMTLTSVNGLRAYQRGGYRRKEYWRNLSVGMLVVNLVSCVIAVGSAYCIAFFTGYWELGWCGIAVGYTVQAVEEAFSRHVPPLRLTARCRRLCGLTILFNGLVAGAVCAIAAACKAAAWAGFLPIIELTLIPLAGFVLKPHEAKRAEKYIVGAKDKLKQVKPFIIGITGSYGKTSCKTALASILSVKYKVCASPASFNTPMGLCRTVNDDLNSEHEILIAEMGARYVGDIKELVEIAPPSLAVVTGIGTQHLETFGSRLALENTKYELVEGLVTDGKAFFADDEGSKRLASKGKGYAVDDPKSPYFVSLLSVEMDEHGSAFTLVTKEGSRRVHTKLIGAHNLANLRLCCTVGLAMGLTLDDLAAGVEKVVPVPHRLQLIPSNNGLQVIDDSYNASMEGVRAAAETLTLFPHKRAVISPGIIESGSAAAMNNFRAGCLFAGAAEYAFIYGPNTKQLAKGLEAGGMREEFIFRVRNRAAAVKSLQSLQGVRVVLFSNDLPN